jgi:hypothetical protein
MQRGDNASGVMEMMLMPAARKDHVERTNRRGPEAGERKRRRPTLATDSDLVVDFR